VTLFLFPEDLEFISNPVGIITTLTSSPDK